MFNEQIIILKMAALITSCLWCKGQVSLNSFLPPDGKVFSLSVHREEGGALQLTGPWSLVPCPFLGKWVGNLGVWSQVLFLVLARGKGVTQSGPKTGVPLSFPLPIPLPRPGPGQRYLPFPLARTRTGVPPHLPLPPHGRTRHAQDTARAVCLMRFHAGGLRFF